MKVDLRTILIIAVVALATWNIRGCFTKKDMSDEYKVEIKHLEEDKKELQLENSELKEDIQALWSDNRRKDSLYEIKKGTIEYRVKNIPVIINAMPDNDVLDAAEKRFGQN